MTHETKPKMSTEFEAWFTRYMEPEYVEPTPLECMLWGHAQGLKEREDEIEKYRKAYRDECSNTDSARTALLEQEKQIRVLREALEYIKGRCRMERTAPESDAYTMACRALTQTSEAKHER